MTTTEALAQVTQADPSRGFGVKEEFIQLAGRSNPGTPEYSVYAHPGYDGTTCQKFTSPDGFDKPVADCLALAKSVAATTNEE